MIIVPNTEGRRRTRWQTLTRTVLLLLAAALLCQAILTVVFRPSNDRVWASDQSLLPDASISPAGSPNDAAGGTLTVRNVRNTVYRSTIDFDVAWETRTYSMSDVDSVWFIVEPFADWRGPAHTFLSFGFKDGEYLAISVEIRKEQGEAFSPIKGLLRQYELAYVFGDERDLIGLRAIHRKDDVFLYRMRATPEQARAILRSMVSRSRQIAEQPEFYNTLTNTCTSNIVDHVLDIAPGSIPWSYKTLLPAYSDDLAYELGLIDTDLPIHRYRSAHRINPLVQAHIDHPEFSTLIRQQSEQTPEAAVGLQTHQNQPDERTRH